MKGIQAYALSKRFTRDTADAMGAVKGAPCEIVSMVHDDDTGITTITFSWTSKSGIEYTDSCEIYDGLGVKDVEINEEGHLIVTYDDDTTQDAGLIPGGGGDYTAGDGVLISEEDEISLDYLQEGDMSDIITPLPTPGGGGGSLAEDLTTSITVGGIPSGSSYEAGTSFETLFRNLLNPTAYPTLTNPSATLSATGAKLLETGATLATTFTITFNRGAINPAYGTSGYRSGTAQTYTLDGDTQGSNTFSKTITSAKTSYQGSVAYAAGEQPKDSTGANYNSPLPAGSVNTNTITYEFVDALWANTSNIGTIAKQALVSKSAKQKDFAFPAQTVANPEVFDVPASWTVTAVQVKNDLSGAYEDAISQFAMTDVTHNDAAGNSVAYKRYTFNLGYGTGARSVRLKWS